MNQGQKDYRFLLDVQAELERARDKFPDTPHTFAALVEEVGEVGKALMDEELKDTGVTNRDVYKELVQVAVMAKRIATEGDNTFEYNSDSSEI